MEDLVNLFMTGLFNHDSDVTHVHADCNRDIRDNTYINCTKNTNRKMYAKKYEIKNLLRKGICGYV